MKMKKKSSAASAKKMAPKKKPAAKSAAPTKAVAKAPAGKAPVAPAETKRRAGTYTPPPVQGIGLGWAPFRYPPQ